MVEGKIKARETRRSPLSVKEFGKCNPSNQRKGSCLPSDVYRRLRKEAGAACRPNQEHCLLDRATSLTDEEKRQLRSTYLRPRYPSEWKQKPDMWLDDLQIKTVLKQYEAAHPWFHFMGVYPIDFSAPDPYHPGSHKCLHPDVCALNLKQEYEKGVRVIGFVFNLDPHFKSGSHWVSMYVDIRDPTKPFVGYFDSYGFQPPHLVRRLMRALRIQAPGARLAYNARRFQYSTTECGVYSIYFLVSMLSGIPFKRFCKKRISDATMLELRKALFTE
jgi:hypothetical protein